MIIVYQLKTKSYLGGSLENLQNLKPSVIYFDYSFYLNNKSATSSAG